MMPFLKQALVKKSRLRQQKPLQHDTKFNKIEADLLILKWMVGMVIVVEILPILKSLF